MPKQFTNNAQDTLDGAITNASSSLALNSASEFPTSGTFHILIDSEIILVGSVSGATFSSLTRGAEGTTAASHSSGATVTLIVTADQLYSFRVERGVHNSRPAASASREGRVYLPSDGIALARDNGASWDVHGPLSPWTPPPSSGWSWVNQGSSSVTTEKDSELLVGAATGSGANLVARVRSAPTPPYTITAHVVGSILSKSFQSVGLCFRQSSDGKIHVFDFTAVTNANPELRSGKFTSATAFSANYQATQAFHHEWFRIADDNTNRVCSYSADGQHWTVFHSIGRTDFLTADQVGFVIGTENAATPNFAPAARLVSWLVG